MFALLPPLVPLFMSCPTSYYWPFFVGTVRRLQYGPLAPALTLLERHPHLTREPPPGPSPPHLFSCEMRRSATIRTLLVYRPVPNVQKCAYIQASHDARKRPPLLAHTRDAVLDQKHAGRSRVPFTYQGIVRKHRCTPEHTAPPHTSFTP